MRQLNGQIQELMGDDGSTRRSGRERTPLKGRPGRLLWARSSAALLAVITAMTVVPINTGGQTPSESGDKYEWLEDVSGERSMAWVKVANERSAKVLESDPRYAQLEATALKVLQSPYLLPIPSINGDHVYNTWQDADQVRGMLRRAA